MKPTGAARSYLLSGVLTLLVTGLGTGCGILDGEDGVVANGAWGGDHLVIQVTDEGAFADYDCAAGTLDVPILIRDGRFAVAGTYTQGSGVERVDEVPQTVPAKYVGRVDGDRMSVTVTLTQNNQRIGDFDLRRGSSGSIYRCP